MALKIAPKRHSPSNQNFVYGPDPLGPDEIRILALLPNETPNTESEIECTLLRLDLRCASNLNLERQPFLALSYVWGNQEAKRTIQVNGKTHPVTDNLFDALLHIRKTLAPVTLWVDALCINQGDLLERNHQVGMMKRIYSDATAVIAWLGETSEPDNEFTQRPFALEQMGEFRNMMNQYQSNSKENPWLLRAELGDQEKSPLIDLNAMLYHVYSMPLWRRVWTMQEIILGQQVFLLWGTCIINLQLLELQLEVADKFLAADFYFHDYDEYLQLYRMAMQPIRMRSKDISFTDALFTIKSRVASLPHDYVYGLLGVVSREDVNINVDYTRPVLELYTDAFQLALKLDSNLDVLSACDRGWFESAHQVASTRGDDDWPSWLPDWSYEPGKGLRGKSGEYQVRIQSILKDCQEYLPVDFRACGSTAPLLELMPRGRLKVRGSAFDAVQEVLVDHDHRTCSCSALDYEIRTQAKELCRDHWLMQVYEKWSRGALTQAYADEADFRNALCLTLSYGHNTDTATFNDFENTCRVIAADGIDRAPRRQESAESNDPFDEEDKAPLAEVLNKRKEFNYTLLFSLDSSDSFCCVTKRGYIARCPMRVEVGDKICVLFGGKVPFVLRDAGNEEYRLVGEIYVHGIMKGAAMTAMREQWTDFVLV